ncbi:MAG: helix-hairpin-helix domain-containing protein, partial [Halothece sp.]
MNTLLTNTGERIQLVESIAQGGEGEVWKTSKKGYLAKIYQDPTRERIDKLQVMLNYPPRDPNADRNHVSFSWPLSLLEDAQGRKAGFLMPAIEGGRELLQVYSPRLRKRENLEVDWRFLHVTALNIASIIQALHQAGYVLGDIKPQNILVNNRALPSIIDTDSFQVRDPVTGEIHRCPVASENYTPVELLGKDITQVNQDEVQDRFRLAVIIHCLLFGDTPFKGKWVGEGDSPEPTELVKQGWWPYAENSFIQPSKLTIPLDIVFPELKSCFLRAFNEGHQQPNLRPSAGEWKQVLNDAVKHLQECPNKTLHVFSSHWRECYWCQ